MLILREMSWEIEEGRAGLWEETRRFDLNKEKIGGKAEGVGINRRINNTTIRLKTRKDICLSERVVFFRSDEQKI